MKKTTFKKGTVRRVLSYVGRYPVSLICVLLFSAVTVGATLLIPVFVGDAIDLIVKQGEVDFQGLNVLFWKIGCFVVVASAAQWLTSFLNSRIALHVVATMRKEAFEKLSKLPLRYIDSHPHGDTVSRIVADADQFADGLLMGFTQFFTGVLTIAGTIGFMIFTNWKIALVVVLVSPVSLFAAKFIASRTHGFFRRQAETRAEETALIEETVSNLKTVQAFSCEEERCEKFEEKEKAYRKASFDATFYSSLTNPVTRCVNNLVYALVALIGGLSIVGGAFTVGGLTKFLSYANQYTKPFNEISGVFAELQNALVCASRAFELVEEEEEPSDRGAALLQNVKGTVSFDDVSFSYDSDTPLIEHLSLSVPEGKKVALVGPTGCGKTTLVNLLMRFYDTTDGKILVDGTPIDSVTRESLRSSYGMVLQDTWLKKATVRDNIRMGRPTATDEEVIAAAKASHAHGFVKRLPDGYDTVLSEDGGSLSQGQKQLLCIARIMLCLPPMLILDEATSSIDTRTEMKIVDAFNRLTNGKTSFVVAHRLSTIRNADLILVMNDGAIVEQGTHDELLSLGGFYSKLYRSQFE